MSTADETLVQALWSHHLPEGAGELPALRFHGPTPLLPSPFHVDVLASASIALATACASAFWARRTQSAVRSVELDRLHAALAFRSERYAEVLDRERPSVWDPIAGDYETRDGFIRLHTNYVSHRDAVLRVLGTPAERSAVTAAVRTWQAEELEQQVVAQGGCAAMLRERATFGEHPQGRAQANAPLFGWSSRSARAPEFGAPPVRPLSGVRVLDLTRVIAGPVCTRFLAAYGAQVLRIDPPGFEEVPALLPDTTYGKRRAELDLKSITGRELLIELLRHAHALIVGYRSDALERLGITQEERARLNPGLVTVALDAYGFDGPWAARRGFDSLVQMSTGIAAYGRKWKGTREPHPLPVQALDHATGYLAAAAACHGLTRAVNQGEGAEVRLSLAGTAELLWQLGTDDARAALDPNQEQTNPYLEIAPSVWGPARRLRCPGAIEGCTPSWTLPAGPLGVDAPTWSTSSHST